MANVSDVDTRPQKGIPLESLIEFAEKGFNQTQIAKLLNCTRSNVSKRLQDSGYSKERLKHFLDNKDKIFSYLQSELVNSLDIKDLKKISLYQRVLCIGILEDKLKQMSAGSTGNINILNQIVINLDKSVRAELKSKGIQDVVIDVPHNEPKKLSD
ncbi:MAG: hypothetical protein ABH870_07510 [bacterium]